MKDKDKIQDLYSNLSNIDVNTRDEKTVKKKKMLILGVSTASIALVGLFAFLMIQNNNNQNVKIEQTKIVQESQQKENVKEAEPIKYVIDLPDWARTTYYALEESDKAKIETYMDNTDFMYLIDVFPGESEGFTSAKDQQFDEEGFPNLMFTLVTKEELKYYTNLYLNMIVNPIFGSWLEHQYPNHETWNEYKERFPFYSENIQSSPFFEDVNNDNYGINWEHEEGETPVRWIGKVNNIYDFVSNDNGDEFKIFANYTMYQNVENGTTKDFNLELTLTVSNEHENRLIISDVQVSEVLD